MPLSKPNQDTINEVEAFLPKSNKSISGEDFTDKPNYERFKADYTDIPNYRRGDLEDLINDIDDFYSEDIVIGAIDDISTDALKSLMPKGKELISDQV